MLSEMLDPEVNRRLFQAIEERLGIDCKQRQSNRILEAIGRKAHSYQYASAQGFIEALLANPMHMAWYQLDEIFTIQTTEFFRESRQMEYLKNELLPQLKQQKLKSGSHKVRLWSCGCATGEEAYSLAMYLYEIFDQGVGWDIKILASDVHQGALAQADRGLYNSTSMLSVPDCYRDTFFTQRQHNEDIYFQVNPTIQSLIEWRSINLMSGEYPVKSVFDCIFCRNLLIYMTAENLQSIVYKLRQKLLAGGLLFFGHSEHLRDTLDLQREKYNIFRAPEA